MNLEIGMTVEVELPQGIFVGKIKEILRGYKQLTGETCYLIRGKNFETITSIRLIRKIVS